MIGPRVSIELDRSGFSHKFKIIAENGENIAEILPITSCRVEAAYGSISVATIEIADMRTVAEADLDIEPIRRAARALGYRLEWGTEEDQVRPMQEVDHG